MKLFDQKFTIIEKGLNAYSKRSEALANNIANVNTPKYKRQDVNFEGLLQRALDQESGTISGIRTNSGHIEINSVDRIENIESEIIQETNTIMRNDGNNVDMEKEQAEFAKNNLRFQFATTRISQDFSLIKSMIKGK